MCGWPRKLAHTEAELQVIERQFLKGKLQAELYAPGAGWGGCTVSLVDESRVGEFIAKLQSSYPPYHGLHDDDLSEVVFPTKPSIGAFGEWNNLIHNLSLSVLYFYSLQAVRVSNNGSCV